MGLFTWSRHPLNFAPLPIFWLCARMTSTRLVFNTVATIYLVVGSLHEEARLREEYRDNYETYLDSGVSFFIPFPAQSGLNVPAISKASSNESFNLRLHSGL